MTPSADHFHDRSLHKVPRLLPIAIGVLALLGLLLSNSGAQLLAYLLILIAAILPAVFWIRTGAAGVPVLPIVSLAYIPYFGWPILSNYDVALAYTPWEIMRAALTVVLFLCTATVSWILIVRKTRLKDDIASDTFENERLIRLLLIGIWVGVAFALASLSGFLGWLGPFHGLARAITGTLATVACFLSGVARGQGILGGKAWAAAIGGLGLLVLLSMSNLFLVGSILYLLAMLFGYVLVTKRIPWFVIGTIFVAVTILHAGKPEMRAKYWETGSAASSAANLPGLVAEWIGEGIYAISSGSDYQSPLERTGLMHMVLLAQSKTPDSIDYLRGATYALLPDILVPRFIDSAKPISGVGMELINIHYGIFSGQDEAFTSIGWGLVAEAYANYGYPCVVGIALILGFLSGALHNWSAGATVISMPTLLSIATIMALINVELDFIQICSLILQSFAAVLIFHTAIRSLASNRNVPTRSGARVI
jgi:hypothetical protein